MQKEDSCKKNRKCNVLSSSKWTDPFFTDYCNNNVFVFVSDGPDDVVIKGDKQAIVGHTVVMNCSFASVPVPTFVWKFNDSVLLGETSTSLTIPHSDYKNSGIYSCEAFNPVTGLKMMATHNLSVRGNDHAHTCAVSIHVHTDHQLQST